MVFRIGPYLEEHTAAVREFNNRVRASPGAFEFPETSTPEWLPAAPGRHIFQERFVAIERGEVRGGYALKHQDFAFRGAAESIACYHTALSESVAEERYRDLDAQLPLDALDRQPLLFTFGPSGAFFQPARAGGAALERDWKVSRVPAYIHIVRPGAFLRNMESLRTTAWRRFGLSLAAFSGAGWAGLRLYQKLKAAPRPAPPITLDFFDTFGPWADDLWARCVLQYPFLAVRDSATLTTLYPGGRFLRIKIASGGKTIGWAVALDTQMQWNREFGDMRLGTILDCLALEEHALHVISAARRVLERRGVDLILCHHSHPAWEAALRGAGFLEGGGDFAFGAAPALAAKLDEAGAAGNLFLMRCDGNARALPEFGHAPV